MPSLRAGTFTNKNYRSKRKRKDHFRRKMNSKNKNICVSNQFYYYFDLPKIRVGWGRTTKNKLPSP